MGPPHKGLKHHPLRPVHDFQGFKNKLFFFLSIILLAKRKKQHTHHTHSYTLINWML